MNELPNMSDEVYQKNKAKLAGLGDTQPASKYHNVRSESKGFRFQSGHEATRISELILLDEKHIIFGLRLQVRFPLPGGVVYVADAVYLEFDEEIGQLQIHVLDAKGMLTKEFKIKSRLFAEKYGQEIELI